MLYRYEVGKRRLEKIWGIHVIPTPNALAGSNFLYEHPEARAEDLMWAMQDKKKSKGIYGIFRYYFMDGDLCKS